MRFKGSLLAQALLAGLAVAPALQAAPTRCENLISLKLPHATIISAKPITAGPTQMATLLGPTTLDVPSR